MNWIHPITVLLTVLLLAFAQSVLPGFRELTSVQPDLLPSVMVYVALHAGLPMTAATALVGGLAFDSLSAGPFGLSVVPLVGIGVFLHLRREVLLRESAWAQALLGAAAALVSSASSLLLLRVLWPLLAGSPGPGGNSGAWPEAIPSLTHEPLVGPGLLWQWLVMAGVGAVGTPALYGFFRWVDTTFQYQPAPKSGYRADRDREIARGRR